MNHFQEVKKTVIPSPLGPLNDDSLWLVEKAKIGFGKELPWGLSENAYGKGGGIDIRA